MVGYYFSKDSNKIPVETRSNLVPLFKAVAYHDAAMLVPANQVLFLPVFTIYARPNQ